MKKLIKYFGKLIISVILISLILIKIRPKILLETLSKVNPIYIVILVIIYLTSLVISSVNLWLLFKGSRIKLLFSRIREVSFASWSIGLLIPGKFGEFTIPFMLKKDNISIGKSFAVIFTDFIITVLSILFIAIIGTIFILRQYIIHIIIFSIILIIILYILTNKRLISFFSKKYKKFNLTIRYFLKTIKELRKSKKYISLNLLLSIGKQFMGALSIYILFKSLNHELNFFIILSISVIIIIISSIPITLNGFGLREGSAIILYSLFNIPGEVVLSSYLINTTIGYLIGIFILFNNKNVKEVLPTIKKLLKNGN